ncbi:kinesin-like protein KIN-12D isoform X2 [Mercurialis annua]|uniref:kinesin-like protein KIN-12D isoform X2 n=1 Tax=Mercurialis annua TaxID=3986 RepID=UPI00216022BA|nr:kinesin-like protein KIN-12D isoform X2 [Mercurialis annua]
MLRDFKFLRRNFGKQNEEDIENVPLNTRDSLTSQVSVDSSSSSSSSRPPLNAIQEPKIEQEASRTSRIDKTPTKPKPKNCGSSALPLRTPDKHAKQHRFGWAQKNNSELGELRDEGRGGLTNLAPRSAKSNYGRANSGYSECNSTQSTPTKSVSKPPMSSGFRSKVDGSGTGGNLAALYRGIPVSGGGLSTTFVNSVEVPHFDLKENPSFWMDHNVQAVIRVRPPNSMEKSMHGYNRCLKQESAQSITWIGQPETRFTFDHIACETVDQEMLFRMACLPMVENCLSGYNSCMFAYGQTGSGKTYTMLGELDDLEVRPSAHRGMTPRIFEFLFARIQAEEESRRDERLKYYCKCSFLEIYNEQITDLLDPSSTNLLLREDVKKGVYVENLSEFEVHTVSDILKLLTQGSLNRKVAATNMNRESSRSHSVFTCVIESRWEKDSTTNLRFARLNLVDLAGSERQKTSGAEGERLKEAANINKSLSTLGHVIMILVDVSNGRPRHVPYRDSRLTFLLQDSLGGNSKTMIIANVSPSICCAAETLNTLKFAQRAKLIQNNAVVNEDSTGDVIALQHQIRLLKEELSLLKRQNVSRSLSFNSTQVQDTPRGENTCRIDQQQVDGSPGIESEGIVRMSTKQLKSLEATLAGALRREQMAETCIKKLEAEIEQLNRLVRHREEETRSTKMMVRFREDKIQKMESLLSGSFPQDTYLLQENRALSEEIQLLQAKLDKNPEVTRFALENIRLLDQLRRFQEFYEEGERDILMDEVFTLREQLIHYLNGKALPYNHPSEAGQSQDAMCNGNGVKSLHLELKNALKELEDCRGNLNSCLEENQKLSREINGLQLMLDNLNSTAQSEDVNIKTIKDSSEAVNSKIGSPMRAQNKVDSLHEASVMKCAEEVLDLQLELDILRIILKEERSSCDEAENRTACLSKELQLAKEKLLFVSEQCEDATNELNEAKSVVEALESEQLLAINEMEHLRKSNSHYMELLREKELEIMALTEQLSRRELRDHPSDHIKGDGSTLQTKLNRMQGSLEKAKRLNKWYQNDRTFQATNEEEMDAVRRQVEAETAEVIVCMQEELSVLQKQVHDCHSKEMETRKSMVLLETELKELHEKFLLLAEDNEQLHEQLEGKDGELKKISDEWELLTCEMTEILADGHDAITHVSDQVDLISSSFPDKRIWISEQVGMLIRIISEKELLIEELGNCLEEANSKRNNVECMLKSLRGAALAINEAHQQECKEKEEEVVLLKSLLKEKISTIAELEDQVKVAEDNASKASVCATAAFVIINRLSEINGNNLIELKYKDVQLCELTDINKRKDELVNGQAAAIKEAEEKSGPLVVELVDLKETYSKLQQRLLEEEKRANGMEQKLDALEQNDILKTREKLTMLQTGVSSLRSFSSLSLKHDISPEMNELTGTCEPLDSSNGGTNAGQELRSETRNSSCSSSEKYEFNKASKDVCDREVTIILLKKEIESALESLRDVQVDVARLHREKEEIQLAEKHSQESWKCITTQLLALQTIMSKFEKKFEQKIVAANHKLQGFGQIVQEIGTRWCQTKEFLELEVGDAMIVAAQKAAEASCIFAKFEETQDTMKEADIMINELLIANETMKLDVKRLKMMEITEAKERLLNQVQTVETECEIFIKDLKTKETALESALESASSHICILDQQNQEMQKDICLLETSASTLRIELDNKFEELSRMCCLEEENKALKGEILKWETENILVLKDLETRNSENTGLQAELLSKDDIMKGLLLDLSLLQESASNTKDQKDKIEEMMASFKALEDELVVKSAELDEAVAHSQMLEAQLQEKIGVISALELDIEKEVDSLKMSTCTQIEEILEENEALKGEILQLKTENILALKDLEKRNSENTSLRDELLSKDDIVKGLLLDLSLLRESASNTKDQKDKIEEIMASFEALEDELVVKSAEIDEAVARTQMLEAQLQEKIGIISAHELNFENEGKSLKLSTCENQELRTQVGETLEENEALKGEILKLKTENILVLKDLEMRNSENTSLQDELLRKDEIMKGLLFDLSLLQESASNTKDQKDNIEEMMASFEALEDELVVKSAELDEAVAHSQMLEAQLQEKIRMISALELDIETQAKSVKMSTSENQELRTQIEETLAAKCSLEQELTERRNLTESLEMELLQLSNAFGQMNSTIESLRNDFDELTSERDQLQVELHILKEKLVNVQAWAEENEAIALEAQQIAESKKIYADEKEAEVKLLERSVEELECTVNVLESKVDILNGEADRQRLQREEIEDELHALNHQMQNVRSADSDMKSLLDEREKSLEESLKQLQILERDIANKDAEIAECKAHISELNLHAEAQASEYKHKFKSLEAMAEQVKPEAHISHTANSSSNKLEKNAAKSRGSGSPFKCIGLGLAQQIKSERDEELSAARSHVEELESLLVCRQKEVFALNARLATAESMTHDVIRDLLGVKLDMTNYASLLDNQQLQKIAEKHQLSSESQPKEVMKLKQQLNEFIEERRGWLEEIDRKRAEMVAAQIALEKFHQRDQLLKAENEMLKMENVNNKKRVMELEGEVKKLSGQQNIQQRIHHHTKIKEENNMLKTQNEDLTAKLKRTENMFSRVKEELAHYRNSIGKSSYIDFDEEHQLMNKLKETEDDRMQIAQKLLGLCTSILKAAGVTKSASNITPAVAEEALEQMKNRLTSMERECQDLTFKNRISNERIRLSELMPQVSPPPPPPNSRMDENCQTPRRTQNSFLSALDR